MRWLAFTLGCGLAITAPASAAPDDQATVRGRAPVERPYIGTPAERRAIEVAALERDLARLDPAVEAERWQSLVLSITAVLDVEDATAAEVDLAITHLRALGNQVVGAWSDDLRCKLAMLIGRQVAKMAKLNDEPQLRSEAIAEYRRCIEYVDPKKWPIHWVDAQLAIAYEARLLSSHSDPDGRIRRISTEAAQAVVDITSPHNMPERWAHAHLELFFADWFELLRKRGDFTSGSVDRALERVDSYQSVYTTTVNFPRWAIGAAVRAEFLEQVFDASEDVGYLADAVAGLERAIEIAEAIDRSEATDMMVQLARIHSIWANQGFSTSHIDDAIALQEMIVARISPDTEYYRHAKAILGLVLFEIDAARLYNNVGRYDRAITLVDRWAETLQAVGVQFTDGVLRSIRVDLLRAKAELTLNPDDYRVTAESSMAAAAAYASEGDSDRSRTFMVQRAVTLVQLAERTCNIEDVDLALGSISSFDGAFDRSDQPLWSQIQFWTATAIRVAAACGGDTSRLAEAAERVGEDDLDPSLAAEAEAERWRIHGLIERGR